MYTISLKDARFYSYHGVHPEEAVLGAWYLVSISVKGHFENAAENDDLQQTLDYGKLYLFAKEEMSQPSKLLETVVTRIKERIVNTGIVLKNIEISLKKLNPPLGGQVAYTEVSFKESF